MSRGGGPLSADNCAPGVSCLGTDGVIHVSESLLSRIAAAGEAMGLAPDLWTDLVVGT